MFMTQRSKIYFLNRLCPTTVLSSLMLQLSKHVPGTFEFYVLKYSCEWGGFNLYVDTNSTLMLIKDK